uniref:Diacylglycerol kinase zeta n=1 Tax=Mus musculus TaxID=10090 RepID=D6RDR3_MOUSE
MSALGAGHSAGGGCDVAAALGPAKVLGTKEAELPGALRQMWRSRSWDVPQIPAEVPQTQSISAVSRPSANQAPGMSVSQPS